MPKNPLITTVAQTTPTAWRHTEVTARLKRLHSCFIQNTGDSVRSQMAGEDFQRLLTVSYEVLVNRAVRLIGRETMRMRGVTPSDLVHDLLSCGELEKVIRAVEFKSRDHFVAVCFKHMGWAFKRLITRMRRDDRRASGLHSDADNQFDQCFNSLGNDLDIEGSLRAHGLADEHIVIVQMRLAWELPPDQIAELLEISRRTVYRRLNEIARAFKEDAS